MTKITASDLAEIQKLHTLWSCGDLSGARADLAGANLKGADLRGANLDGANLMGAKYTHKGVEAEKFLVMTNLYKYTTIAIIDKTGKHWIALGCKFQSREDWQTQFWNNLPEFPNDNSLKTRKRQFALRTAEAWLDMMSSPEVQ